MDWRKKSGPWAFKYRGAVWTGLFLIMLFLAYPTKASILCGVPLCALGQALRCWATGCIGRYRGEIVGAEELVTWGPYAFSRNPLYIANGLIGLGWGIMAGWLAVAVFLPLYCLLYAGLIIPHEESFLAERFSDEYERYKARTKRYFSIPKQSAIHGPFSPFILWKSERHSLWTLLIGTAFLILKMSAL
jgi:protein-S-isoprenylcysteine O-methyltransferase Ste14